MNLFSLLKRDVLQGAVEGDYVTKTQPFPTKPKPLTPTYLDPDDVFGFTPWDRGYCKKAAQDLRNEGLYTPPSIEGSVHYLALLEEQTGEAQQLTIQEIF